MIKEFTKKLFLGELSKLIQDKNYMKTFHDLIAKISFHDEFEDILFENEMYELLLLRIDEYLDEIESGSNKYQLELLKSLYYVVENDLLEEEYIFSVFNNSWIEEIYLKYKRSIITFDVMSSHLNKSYNEEIKMDISKIIKIYEDGLIKKFWI